MACIYGLTYRSDVRFRVVRLSAPTVPVWRCGDHCGVIRPVILARCRLHWSTVQTRTLVLHSCLRYSCPGTMLALAVQIELRSMNLCLYRTKLTCVLIWRKVLHLFDKATALDIVSRLKVRDHAWHC